MSLKNMKMNLTSSLKIKPKPTKTFKTYVDLGLYEKPQSISTNKEQLEVVEEIDLTPSLLPGEAVITRVDHVLRYNAYSELKTGISGALFCTNFKVAFVTTENFPSNLHLHHLFLGENDISLLNIESINMNAGSKKKRLSALVSPNVIGEDIVEIRCKNFSIHTFSFKFSPKGQSKQFIKAVTHHAFVNRVQRLFLFDYIPPPEEKPKKAHLLYSQPSDWYAELNRCGVKSGWRVTQANETFQLCDNLPRSMVIPASVIDALLFQSAPCFVGHRIPVWSWGLNSGASLVRMSLPDVAVTDDGQVTRKLLEAIKNAHPSKADLCIVDLSQDLPSPAEIASSYSKLKEICSPASSQAFWEQDIYFLGSLDNSHWLSYVSRCLKTSLDIALAMATQHVSVVIQEFGARDICCIVASLIQLILDPETRTIPGFQALIEKEWVALGHPFTERLGHVSSAEMEKSPVFLLFLDCVWQLLQQFPASFQFTETYLTVLWDSAHISLFDTLLFSCHKLREDARASGLKRSFSLWEWNQQYSPHNISLFYNPLFVLNQFRPSSNSLEKSRPKSANHLEISSALRNQNVLKDVVWTNADEEDILKVDPYERSLSLWKQCYLRWVPAAQVIGGGDAVIFLWNKKISEDIKYLTKLIESLNTRTSNRKSVTHHRRMASDDFLFTTELDSSELRPDNIVLTSAFPFSPVGPWDVRNYRAVPSSSYLHVSYVSSEEEEDDD